MIGDPPARHYRTRGVPFPTRLGESHGGHRRRTLLDPAPFHACRLAFPRRREEASVAMGVFAGSAEGRMMRTMIAIGVILLSSATLADSAPPAPVGDSGSGTKAMTVEDIVATKERLKPLFVRMGKPKPGDWLESHREPGQTFKEYVRSNPTRPGGKRSVLYVQPIGDFTEKQRSIVTLTSNFMSQYFNLPTVVLEGLPVSVIPKDAQRVHPAWGDKQVLTGYLLDHVLKPRLPEDAAASIAFTACDLWPGEGWNFVFGQASLQDRVGVWSIYRNGNADGKPEDFRLCLLRTMKTATHETGHMFGMQHCIAYECNMCGSNNREEADRRPLQLCPECVAKVWWATGADPLGRYEGLASFCEKQGLKPAQDFYQRLISAWK
jgi:archaemetzincin